MNVVLDAARRRLVGHGARERREHLVVGGGSRCGSKVHRREGAPSDAGRAVGVGRRCADDGRRRRKDGRVELGRGREGGREGGMA